MSAAVRAAKALLFDLAGRRIAAVTMVVDDRVPQIVMFEGDPFLWSPNPRPRPEDVGTHEYKQVRPYRADAMVTEMLG